MGFFSILPAYLAPVEVWIGRIFLLAAVLTIGPWFAVILYDLLLYIARCIAHELPMYGGRARGRHRPRAPSLSERPSGRARQFSFAGLSPGSSSTEVDKMPADRNASSNLKDKVS